MPEEDVLENDGLEEMQETKCRICGHVWFDYPGCNLKCPNCGNLSGDPKGALDEEGEEAIFGSGDEEEY